MRANERRQLPLGKSTSNPPSDSAFPSPSYKMSEKIARRKKAKKIATIVGTTGLAGVTLFSIIAFLGRVSGNFTVNINQASSLARLQLSETKDFASPSVHLKAPGLDNASCASSDDVLKVGDEANIAENGGSYSEKLDEIRYDEDGNEISRINRGLVYSCFLLNPSSAAVKFDLSLVMTGYSSPSNAAVEPYSLLRVGIWHTRYAMDGSAEASLFKCFAADNTTTRYSGDGIRIEDDPREYVGESHLMRGTHLGENITYRRLDQTIATDPRSRQKADSFTGYLGGEGIFSERYRADNEYQINALQPGQMSRFTFAFWFEGGDPDGQGPTPQGASMTFQMNFTPSVL